MSWSYKIARIAGIDIKIHATFLILLAYFAVRDFSHGGINAAIVGTVFVLCIFGCVVLHEFGHAMSARAFGIETPDITLLPIGGVARLERMPRSPWQELIISAAGPAVNVVLAAILLPIAFFYGKFRLDDILHISFGGGELLDNLVIVNICLLVFNLIPAYPMDGGRILRAVLVIFTKNYYRATIWAGRAGQVFAVAFGLWGISSGNFILIFIAFFIFSAAQREIAAAQYYGNY